MDESHIPISFDGLGGTLDLEKALDEFIRFRYEKEGLDYDAPYPKRGEVVVNMSADAAK